MLAGATFSSRRNDVILLVFHLTILTEQSPVQFDSSFFWFFAICFNDNEDFGVRTIFRVLNATTWKHVVCHVRFILEFFTSQLLSCKQSISFVSFLTESLGY